METDKDTGEKNGNKIKSTYVGRKKKAFSYGSSLSLAKEVDAGYRYFWSKRATSPIQRNRLTEK